MGHWSIILGHTAKNIKKKAIEQIKNGWMHGTVNIRMRYHFLKKFQKQLMWLKRLDMLVLVPRQQCMLLRLARAITGKKTIAKIDGGWHGYTTDLLKTVNWPFDQIRECRI